MGKLKVECSCRKIKIRKIAKTVYKLLGQKDNLFAELVFVSEEEIRKLNRDTRAKDSVTDVLSFPTLDGIRGEILDRKHYPCNVEGKKLYIGSIAICYKRAEAQAQEYGHSTEREVSYLIIHGLLHLMGYDHIDETDKKQMRTLEKAALSMLKMEEVQ